MHILPLHLAGNQATGVAPGEPVAQFELGKMKNFVYLILDWKTRKAAIIDPQSDLDTPLGALKKEGFTLEAILLTHTHFDHIAGLPGLAKLHPNVPIYLHSRDQHRLSPALQKTGKLSHLNDGDELEIGSLSLEVLHTPGHSAGECTYLLKTEPPFLFSGDTIFIRDCGRTDLESGNNEEMFQSLQRIKGLAPETIILPGHHYKTECATTIAKEVQESPPFQCRSVKELEALP